jgi:hypothetical protein
MTARKRGETTPAADLATRPSRWLRAGEPASSEQIGQGNETALTPSYDPQAGTPTPVQPDSMSRPKSRAGLEWVRAPTATKSTPVSATARAVASRRPPLASRRTDG